MQDAAQGSLRRPWQTGLRGTMIKDSGGLPTPLVADACVRCGVPLRAAPPGIGAAVPGARIAGRVLPARHYGSVDVFLEALSRARPGDVLVAGNGGRADEACTGDLVVLEAQAAGLAGLVVWGLHRDGPELAEIGLPVFSYGCYPPGPVRLAGREPGALATARFGPHLVTGDDVIFGDDDGVLFVAAGHAGKVLATAQQIWQTERGQARRILSRSKIGSGSWPAVSSWRQAARLYSLISPFSMDFRRIRWTSRLTAVAPGASHS
jgi:4-hydroxy-4-methyl-2-oxoglutarate aldolase